MPQAITVTDAQGAVGCVRPAASRRQDRRVGVGGSLRLVLCRMWQWPFVFEHLAEVAHEVLPLIGDLLVDVPADVLPRGTWSLSFIGTVKLSYMRSRPLSERLARSLS